MIPQIHSLLMIFQQIFQIYKKYLVRGIFYLMSLLNIKYIHFSKIFMVDIRLSSLSTSWGINSWSWFWTSLDVYLLYCCSVMRNITSSHLFFIHLSALRILFLYARVFLYSSNCFVSSICCIIFLFVAVIFSIYCMTLYSVYL